MKKTINQNKRCDRAIGNPLLILFTVILAAFLTMSNYLSLKGLFRKLDCTAFDQVLYASTLTVLLNGIPCYLALFCSKLGIQPADTGRTRIANTVGLILSVLTYVLVAGVTVMLRLLWISSNGGLTSFIAYRYGTVNNKQFIADMFELFSPILVSLLIFIAVWLCLRSHQEARQAAVADTESANLENVCDEAGGEGT